MYLTALESCLNHDPTTTLYADKIMEIIRELLTTLWTGELCNGGNDLVLGQRHFAKNKRTGKQLSGNALASIVEASVLIHEYLSTGISDDIVASIYQSMGAHLEYCPFIPGVLASVGNITVIKPDMKTAVLNAELGQLVVRYRPEELEWRLRQAEKYMKEGELQVEHNKNMREALQKTSWKLNRVTPKNIRKSEMVKAHAPTREAWERTRSSAITQKNRFRSLMLNAAQTSQIPQTPIPIKRKGNGNGNNNDVWGSFRPSKKAATEPLDESPYSKRVDIEPEYATGSENLESSERVAIEAEEGRPGSEYFEVSEFFEEVPETEISEGDSHQKGIIVPIYNNPSDPPETEASLLDSVIVSTQENHNEEEIQENPNQTLPDDDPANNLLKNPDPVIISAAKLARHLAIKFKEAPILIETLYRSEASEDDKLDSETRRINAIKKRASNDANLRGNSPYNKQVAIQSAVDRAESFSANVQTVRTIPSLEPYHKPYHYCMFMFSSRALQTALNSLYVGIYGRGYPIALTGDFIPVSESSNRVIVRNLSEADVFSEIEKKYGFNKTGGNMYQALLEICKMFTSRNMYGSDLFIKNRRFTREHSDLTINLNSIPYNRAQVDIDMISELLNAARSAAVILPMALDLEKQGLQIKELKGSRVLTERDREEKFNDYKSANEGLIVTERGQGAGRKYDKTLTDYLYTSQRVMEHLIDKTVDKSLLTVKPKKGEFINLKALKGGKRTRKLYKHNRTRLNRLKNKSKKRKAR
jgi:hypothetical protein